MKFSKSVSGDVTTIRMTGDINDGSEEALEALVGAVQTPTAVLHCGELGNMNSLGVAAWCSFVADLQAKAHIEFQEVPAILVHFAGLVRGFFGKGDVSSFKAPYFCPACSTRETLTVDSAKFVAAQVLPVATCPSCQKPMKDEVDTEGYIEILLECINKAG